MESGSHGLRSIDMWKKEGVRDIALLSYYSARASAKTGMTCGLVDQIRQHHKLAPFPPLQTGQAKHSKRANHPSFPTKQIIGPEVQRTPGFIRRLAVNDVPMYDYS